MPGPALLKAALPALPKPLLKETVFAPVSKVSTAPELREKVPAEMSVVIPALYRRVLVPVTASEGAAPFPPSAVVLPSWRVPEASVVPPVYVLLPAKFNVPPRTIREPEPEITPDWKPFCRLKAARAPASSRREAAPRLPPVLRFPNCKVPVWISAD